MVATTKTTTTMAARAAAALFPPAAALLLPLMAATALLPAPAAAQAVDRTAAVSDVFTVSGIPVDVTAENAVAAREQALEAGQREGLARLLRRLAPESAYGRLPALDGEPIERYVRNFEVGNERLSTTRYIARLTVNYDPAAVRDLLRDAGVPFAESLSEPLLVLPLYETPDGLQLWQEGNPWWQAWSQAMDRESLLRLRLPLGDLEDVQAIDADLKDIDEAAGAYVPPGERPALRRIADRYDARGVIVAHAQVESEGGGDAGGAPPTVVVNAQGFGAVDDVGDFTDTVRGQPGQSLEEVLLAAVLRVQDALSAEWKEANLLRFDQAGTILVEVPLDSLQGWVSVKSALTSLPQVGEVEVEAFSRDRARLRVDYFGGTPRLQAELASLGLLLTQEEGDTWQLLRTAGEPSPAATPFGAATSTSF